MTGDAITLASTSGKILQVEESVVQGGSFYIFRSQPHEHYDRDAAIILRDFLTKIIDASTPKLPTTVGSRIRVTDTEPIRPGAQEVFEATLTINAPGNAGRTIFLVTKVDGKPAMDYSTFQAEGEPAWAYGKDTEWRWEVLYDAGAENHAG